MKIKQNGYLAIKIGDDKNKKVEKWLHFSTNCWFNLEEDTGKDVLSFMDQMNKGNTTQQFKDICQIAFAAMKAYDQENGNDIDYNIYKVRDWLSQNLDEKSAERFVAAMTWNIDLPDSAGKPNEGK